MKNKKEYLKRDLLKRRKHEEKRKRIRKTETAAVHGHKNYTSKHDKFAREFIARQRAHQEATRDRNPLLGALLEGTVKK